MQSYVDRRIVNPSSPQLARLLTASNKARTDLNANCNSSMQLFGEYLHTFEDTFAHRDQENNPYDKASDSSPNFDDKIAILNNGLKALGYSGIKLSRGGADGYDEGLGAKNRGDALNGLKPDDYVGTILPQGAAPLPK